MARERLQGVAAAKGEGTVSIEQDAISLAVKNSLYAYGMAYKCQHEVDKLWGAGYPAGYMEIYLEGSAQEWLNEARQWRRIAEAMP